MSDAVDPHLTEPDGPRTSSCATELVCRDCGYRTPLLDTAFKCPACGEGLDIDYDYERAKHADRRARARRSAPGTSGASRSCCRSSTARAQQRVGQFAGKTPLIHAERLGAELGLSNLYLKDDSTNRPTLSYKDRVVEHGDRAPAGAGQGRGRLRLDRQRRHRGRRAGRQGRRHAYIFYPGNMEKGKAKACRALGAQVCQLDGNYDQANRACRELSLASGMEFANITLRPFYAEGAKTMAFEVVEELGWSAPDHFVIPAAGGTLSSRVHKGLDELETVGLAETAGTRRSTSPRPAAARRSRPRSSAAARSSRRRRRRRRTRWRSAPPATAPWSSTRCARAAARRRPPPTRRSSARSTCSARPRGSSPSRPAGRRSPPPRGSPRKGRSAPDETVVAVISGNGLKTLHEHPEKHVAGNGRLRRRDDGARCSTTSARRPRPRCAD